MNKSLQQVAEFHTTFEHPIADTPLDLESLKIRQLRIKLLFEELAELAEASDCLDTFGKLCDNQIEKMASCEGGYTDGDNVDKKEELDALCDIQYVLNGKILTSGLHRVFDKAFDVVHHNNMTKAHRSVEHCRETVAALGGVMDDYTIVPKSEGIMTLQNKSGKVIKPHDHVKVRLNIVELMSEVHPEFPG